MQTQSFDWKSLISGTDLRGGALGEGAVLTPERAAVIGAGFGAWIRSMYPNADRPTIAVGRDSRLSGESLSRSLRTGISSAGARVLDLGLSTTPAMFEATQHEKTKATAAVMVTASHLPANRNGFKFILQTGGLESSQLNELVEFIKRQPFTDSNGSDEAFDFLPLYTRKLTDFVSSRLSEDAPLSGLKVVVDASNGSGGFYERWLASLGADTTGSIFLEPDGRFLGHAPNPEDKSAILALSNAVLSQRADIGVIFDADCDRAALVASDGSPLSRERLICLCADLLSRDKPGATIVTDSVTSPALTHYINSRGLSHRRFKRGYKNVISEALRLNAAGMSCPLAMETSGHAAFRENRFLDDGMYLATLVIIEAVRAKRSGEDIVDRLSDLRMPVEELEKRIPVADAGDRKLALSNLTAWLNTKGADKYILFPNEAEGVRAETKSGDGWLLLRSSLHDPLIVLNAEGYAEGSVNDMLLDIEDATKIKLL
ncbi:phosphoglucomutase [Clostridia bacterium]|nr:phosphoglucomutase [Clostridia bacterium]